MHQKTTLSINTPCVEKFDNFLQTEKGGFCTICQKEVIDFRNWTDEAIANHFNTTTQKTCGLFKEAQLKTYSREKNEMLLKRKSYLNIGLASFSLLSLFAVGTASAQTKGKPEIVQTPNQQKQNPQTEGIIVRGVVYDKLGPLPGANVVVKGLYKGVQTNLNGEFTFPKPLIIGDVLIVSYVGFKTKEVVVSQEPLSIVLLDEEIAWMGEVAVAREYHSKPSFFQRIRNWFRNE
ncbi:carboxypeptidase-like regulatory domain-containing protein [Flavobacterium sp. J27]|uniref:carboxypeptidase-like regulatory domain-containing protein n=1 Tax=Flavobacterium sp. J27 TaxID=2060419 RepID=UPI0010302A97|nr:carboxypeptidase-like regulatory domain-containing protein [Flavobacterium sp. J27]